MSERSAKKPYVIGIDPGTGSSSGAGVAVIDANEGRLIHATSVWGASSRSPAYKRIRDIANSIGGTIRLYESGTSKVFIESFVMRGKGGETLARFTGAVMAVLPEDMVLEEVANTKVKLLVGGKGDVDKMQLAESVYNHFENCPASTEIIEHLVLNEDYDALDAIAIALAGVKYYGAA